MPAAIKKARAGRNLAVNAALAAEDALALARLSPLSGRALPWTTFSMRPAAISTLISEIIVGRRRRIIECGSGNSTIYIARLLAQLGTGTLTSLDHDSAWASATAGALDDESLTAASVKHCPLVDGWYSVDSAGLSGRYDMLIVDGPPGNVDELGSARYPAVPRLLTYLADDATVALDDVNRPGEQQTLQRWTDTYGFSFERPPGGLAIGRRAA